MGKVQIPIFLYDNQYKQTYLEEIMAEGYSESQFNVAVSFLQKIGYYESKVGMPCYRYSSEGLLDLLGTINTSSLATLKTFVSTLRNYIVYINSLEGNPSRNTAVMNIDTQDLIMLINPFTLQDKYITKKEYWQIITLKEDGENSDINWSDLALFTLLWNGIKGTNYSDIIQFRRANLIEDKNIVLINNQLAELSDLEVKIMLKAFEEKEYQYYNKFTNTGFKRQVNLLDNDYLFKATDHVNAGGQHISVNSLKGRLTDFINTRLVRPSMTGVSLFSSGLVYRALEAYNFNPPSTLEIDRIINARGGRVIAYAKVSEIKDILLNKIGQEDS